MPNRPWTSVTEAANRMPGTVMCIACALLAVPALGVGCDALRGTLGVNPLATLISTSGRWALIWLLAALAMPPLRQALLRLARWNHWRYGKRLSDWNWFIRLRRAVGLASFFYSVAHLVLYVSLDLDFNGADFAGDLRDKPYIGVGIAAFALLLPLAITSTNAWRKRLQRTWERLHMLVYPAAILAVAHFLLLTKPGVTDPMPYTLVLAILLVRRFTERRLRSVSQEHTDGVVPERSATAATQNGAEAVRQP
jgi:methionine sulfoxide reductase heme-binding subunit